jgi:hypothetical protein
MPDCISALPLGRIIWFEFKKPKTGILSEAQQDIHERLRRLSHLMITCDSIETCRYGLNAAGIKLNEAADQLAIPPKIRVQKSKIAADRVPFC